MISRSLTVEILLQNLFRAIEFCGEYTENEADNIVREIKKIMKEVLKNGR